MRLTKKGWIAVAAFAALALVPTKAHALTFTLDCFISDSNTGFNGSCPTMSSSLATLTLTQSGNVVTGLLDLTGLANGEKAMELDLNFDTTTYNPANISVTGGLVTGFDATPPPPIKADGFPGDFDLTISFDTSGASNDPITFTISYLLGASLLNVNTFNTKDSTNTLFAALHIGGFANGCSIWVGESGTSATPGGTETACGSSDGGGGDTVVLEPASLGLFGLGALAAAARARRRKTA